MVDDCVSGDAAERSKPHPDIIVAALRSAATEARRAVLIGDTPYDVEAARAAGVGCIGVRSGGWTDEQLEGAIAVFQDPADLLVHLDDIPLRPRLSGTNGSIR